MLGVALLLAFLALVVGALAFHDTFEVRVVRRPPPHVPQYAAPPGYEAAP